MAKKLKPKKPEAAKPKHPEMFENVEYQHNLSDAESLLLLKELTKLNQSKENLEAQKKASAAGWKNQIDTVTNKIKSITTTASNGFEMKPINARVEYDRKAGKKTYFFPDDGKIIRTEEMTATDYERLPINVEEKKEPLKPGDNIVNVGDVLRQAEASLTDVNDD
jgi:hypothetical protein